MDASLRDTARSAPAAMRLPPDMEPGSAQPGRRSTPGLALLALGIVYGDIGTSPLYAARETFSPDHGIPLTTQNILGGVSAIFWVLMIVVSLKYVSLVLRADNRGEGGIMALLALATAALKRRPKMRRTVMLTGVLGAALFYGDAVLTPAISVLSAVEGLEVGTSALKPYVVPVSAGVLLALFMVQRHGTRAVGLYFGPVCALWFAALATVGAWNIARAPQVLQALDPRHAIRFVTAHGTASFLVLGAVLLAITGAEALYADVGHFGKRAIRLAWFAVVAPALVLNYLGQGALLMVQPEAVANPFYLAFPQWALYPMVALATAATVIASQATISGAYSMTQQAIQLGFLPRMAIRHTSSSSMGQIYVPAVNWILLLVVGATVVGFGSSSRLASAYGVAVMGTMLVTTMLTYFVLRDRWGYPAWLCMAATAAFGSVDLTLLAAALHKVLEGGWFPLVLAGVVFLLMTTWRRGRTRLMAQISASSPPLVEFLRSLFQCPPLRVPGTAVFLSASAEATPNALLHSLKHYKVLHARNVFLTVEFRDVAWVATEDRIACVPLPEDCWHVRARFGFMESPDVGLALARCGRAGLQAEPMEATYFLSRETIVPRSDGMAAWRERLFAALARNAGSIADFFNIPSNRVVELGTRVAL